MFAFVGMCDTQGEMGEPQRCVDDPECSDLPVGCQRDSDCDQLTPPRYCQLNGICDAAGKCVGECMVIRPPCHKDRDCPLDEICNTANACVAGTQGCEERFAGDPDCPRSAGDALDPAAVASDLNQRFLSDTTGVLVHWLDGTTEQETGWQFCTDTTDPGCDPSPGNAQPGPDMRPPPPRTVTCGRSAFSVLNHLGVARHCVMYVFGIWHALLTRCNGHVCRATMQPGMMPPL